MFTGIIEQIGTVRAIRREGGNVHFSIAAKLATELQIDQSIAHDGVCLTVVELEPDAYTVTAIHETLQKTNLENWQVGTEVNLERCTLLGGRLDGHLVQGHVDSTAELVQIETQDGSWLLTFQHPIHPEFTTVPKGSITVNGISLTVVDSGSDRFSVAIIPYTWEHTNLHRLACGDRVNLEFDIIGKYVARMLSQQGHRPA